MAQTVFVTPSTTLVQVNTLQSPYTPVILNSYSYTGQVVTILDNTSSFGVLFSSIVVSTAAGTSFTDLSISTVINQPQGFLTVQSHDTNLWAFLNSFPFRNQYLSAGLYTLTTSTFTTAILSSIQQYANSLDVEKLVVSGNFIQSSPITFNQTISTFGSVDLYSSVSVWQSTFFSSGLSTLGAVQLVSTLTVDGNLYSFSSILALSTVFISGSVSVADFVSAGMLSLSSGLVTNTLFVSNSTDTAVIIAGSVDVGNEVRALSSVNVGGDLTLTNGTMESFSTLSSLASMGPFVIQDYTRIFNTFSNRGKLTVLGHLSTGAMTTIYEDIFGGSNLTVSGYTEIRGFVSSYDFFTSSLFVQGDMSVKSSNAIQANTVVMTSSATVSALTVGSLRVGGVFSTTASASLYGTLYGEGDFVTRGVVSTRGLSTLGDVVVDSFSSIGNVNLYRSTYFMQNLLVLSTSFWNQIPVGPPPQIEGDLMIGGNLIVQDTLTLSSIVLPSSVVANNFFVSSLFVGDIGIVSSATISSIETSSIGSGGIQKPEFTVDMANDLIIMNLSTFLLSSLIFQASAPSDSLSFFHMTSSLGVGLTASTNTFQVNPLAVTTCNLISLKVISSLQIFGDTITARLEGDASLLSNTRFPARFSTSFIQLSSLVTQRLEASSFFTSTILTDRFIPTSTLIIGDLSIYGNTFLPPTSPLPLFETLVSLSTPYILGVPIAEDTSTNLQVRLNTLIALGDNLGEASFRTRGAIINYNKLLEYENPFLIEGSINTLVIGDTLRVDDIPDQRIEFKEFRGDELVLNGGIDSENLLNIPNELLLYGGIDSENLLNTPNDTPISLINSGPTYVSSGFIAIGASLLFLPKPALLQERSTNTIQTVFSTLQFNSTLFVNREASAVGINTNPYYTLDVKGTAYVPSSVFTNFSTILENQVTVNQSLDRYWLGVGQYVPGLYSNLRFSRDGITWENASSTSEATLNNIGSDGGRLTIQSKTATGTFLEAPTTWVAVGFYDFSFYHYGYMVYMPNPPSEWSVVTFIETEAKRQSYEYTSVQFNGAYWLGTGLNYIEYNYYDSNQPNILDSPTTTLFRSEDGITWNFMESGGFKWNSRNYNYLAGGRASAWNGEMWVAVGLGSNTGNSILYSADGSNWSDSVNGFQISDQYGAPESNARYSGGFDVKWTGKHWVAVGQTYSNFYTPFLGILYSSTGSNWTEATVSSSNTIYNPIMRTLGWNGSRLVAGGEGTNPLLYSDDHGVNWFPCNPIQGVSCNITWNGSYWLASGVGEFIPSPTVAKSMDGITWTFTNPSLYLPTYGVAYTSNAVPNMAIGSSTLQFISTIEEEQSFIVVVGSNSTTPSENIYTSSDGSNFTLAPTGGFNVRGNCVAYGGGLWLAGGSDTSSPSNNLLQSTDGETWNAIDLTSIFYSPSPEFYSLFYANGTWIAGTDYSMDTSKTVIYSTDGLGWFAGTNDTPNNATYAIGYGPTAYDSSPLFVIAGWPGDLLYTSPDGTSWTTQYPISFFSYLGGINTKVYGLLYSGTYWLAIGDTGGVSATIKFSQDAYNWNEAAFITSDFTVGYGVAYNGSNLWVAVGETFLSNMLPPTYYATMKYSSDARNWYDAVSGQFLSTCYSVTYNTSLSLWIATGLKDTTTADTVRYSGDGSNWSNGSGAGFNYGRGVGSKEGSQRTTAIQNYYNQLQFYNNPFGEITNRQATPYIAYTPSSLTLNKAILFDSNQNVFLNSQAPLNTSFQSTFVESQVTNVTQTVSTQRMSIGLFTLGTQYI